MPHKLQSTIRVHNVEAAIALVESTGASAQKSGPNHITITAKDNEIDALKKAAKVARLTSDEPQPINE